MHYSVHENLIIAPPRLSRAPTPYFFQGCILPETNSLHLKIAGWKRRKFFLKIAGAKMIQKNLSEEYFRHNSRQHIDVSKNRGTPKWMVYNGKPYQNGWFGGTTIFGNPHTPPKHPDVTSYSWASLSQKLIGLPGATSQNISNSTEEAGSSTSTMLIRRIFLPTIKIT